MRHRPERFRQIVGISYVLLAAVSGRPTASWFAAGALLVGAGVVVRLWASGHIHKNRELATTGPYSFVRHPLYTGNLRPASVRPRPTSSDAVRLESGMETVRPHILVRTHAVTREYPAGRRGPPIRAVDGVDLSIPEGRTTALVGESGCGKSTLARLILRLQEPSAGRVEYRGRDLAEMSEAELRGFRRRAQIVFQDPYASLNPRLTVGSMLREVLRVHRIGTSSEAQERVRGLLDRVGLSADSADRYPHEFSGGQRQRIGIARALAVEPEFLVLDEPVSALDVSVQAQVLNLLRDLQADLGLTFLFVSHDLGVVRNMADRIVVMRAGAIVEAGESGPTLAAPGHEYTRQLLAAVPRIP